MIRLPLLFAFTAASVWLAWSLLGAPIAVPPSPLGPGETLPCVSYTPYQGSQTPFDQPLVISDQQITADMERLAKITSCIRTYSAGGAQRRVTRIAASQGLKVIFVAFQKYFLIFPYCLNKAILIFQLFQ